MATSSMSQVIQHLRKTVLHEGAETPDGQLLDCFVSRGEDAALETLVRRHGPMVWGVCRRVLHAHHDAEDAFQATFLVLVRKAASIVPKEMVGNWLYGVAHQTALKARATLATRKTRETQLPEVPESEVVPDNTWHDLQPLLDQELSTLQDKYRAAIVLCDLEGKTRKEAARQLGLAEGTVASRLARARVMLAKRLARHGLELSGGAVAVAMSQEPASAYLPPSVLSSTIRAAIQFAAGQAAAEAISPTAAALMTGVTKAMCVTKIKSVVAVMLAVGLGLGMIGLGVNLLHDRSQAAEMQEAMTKIDLPGGPKPAASDKERVQGEWAIVGIEEDAKQASNRIFQDEAKYHKVIVRGDKLIFFAGTEIENAHAFTLDQSKKVKEIDLIRDGTHQPGIYSLKDDLWIMNIAGRTEKRPTGFETEKSQLLLVLKRKVKAEQKPKEGEPKEDRENIQGMWKAVIIEEEGRVNDFSAVPPNDPSAIVYFAGDKWIAGNGTTVFTFKLDSSKTPKTIDLQKQDGSKKAIRGTYELGGDNLKLSVCYTNNPSRPTIYGFKRANSTPDDKKQERDGNAKKNDFIKGDYRRLQGDWKMSSIEYQGRVSEGEAVASIAIPKWNIEGNTINVIVVKPPFEGGGPVTWKGSFKLDTSTNPKRITVTEVNGGNKIVNNGIYSLDSDILKICVNAEGGEAPTKCETKVGSPNRIFILKREAGKESP